jgi:hypothetical protein
LHSQSILHHHDPNISRVNLSHLVWRSLGSGGHLAAPAALTQQPTTTISRCSWKFYPQLLYATIFPGSEFLFSQGLRSKLLASDNQRGHCWSICAAAKTLKSQRVRGTIFVAAISASGNRARRAKIE